MKVEIYGAEWCTFCKQAVKLCETKGVEYNYVDVDDTANLRSLEERIGGKAKTIPQIFLDGQHIPAGYTGLQKELAKT